MFGLKNHCINENYLTDNHVFVLRITFAIGKHFFSGRITCLEGILDLLPSQYTHYTRTLFGDTVVIRPYLLKKVKHFPSSSTLFLSLVCSGDGSGRQWTVVMLLKSLVLVELMENSPYQFLCNRSLRIIRRNPLCNPLKSSLPRNATQKYILIIID